MSLNQNFTVKNGLNTLGNILSSGTNLLNIFALSGAGSSTPNALTFNTTGGASAGTTFNGSSPVTIDYHTIGASPLAGSSSIVTVGTITSGTWNGNTIGLSYGGTGATTQQGAINAIAGSVTSGQYLRGNGTNVVMSAIQASDVPTLNQNTTGSAATLTTSRNIWGQAFNGSADVIGNLSNVGNITGSGAITISTASNGNISLSPNGTGIVTTGSSFQAASATITGNTNVGGNLSVGGSIYFGGSAIQIVQNELVVNEPVIYLANVNPADTLDIGFVGHNVYSGTYAHTGLLRSNPSGAGGVGTWYLFSSMVTEPSGNSVATNSKVTDTLVANIQGNISGGTVSGSSVTVTNGSQQTNSNIFYYSGSSNPSTAIPTFNNTTYKTAKYVFRINKSGGASASGEILVNYNTGNSTWEGTVYGILDSGNIFSGVDVSTSSSTIDLTFTFIGAGTYNVTIIGNAF
jgi:hypothetical protein